MSPKPKYLAQNLFCKNDSPITVLLYDYRSDQPEIYYHTHDFYELVVVLNGVGVHKMQQGEHKICVGDTFLIRPGEGHSYNNLRRLKIANILYQPRRFQKELKIFRSGANNIFPEFNPFLSAETDERMLNFSGEIFHHVHDLIQRMAMEQQSQNVGRSTMLQLLFLELLMLVYRSGRKKMAIRAELPEKVIKLRSYVDENYFRRITLEELAKLGNISIPSVNRLWRKNLQTSPMEYLMRLRLDKAGELLRESRLPLSEIADRTGFCDSNYLTKCFHRYFQDSPRQYRQKHAAASSDEEHFENEAAANRDDLPQ